MHVYVYMYKYLDRAVNRKVLKWVMFHIIIYYMNKSHVQFDDRHTLKLEQLMI